MYSDNIVEQNRAIAERLGLNYCAPPAQRPAPRLSPRPPNLTDVLRFTFLNQREVMYRELPGCVVLGDQFTVNKQLSKYLSPDKQVFNLAPHEVVFRTPDNLLAKEHFVRMLNLSKSGLTLREAFRFAEGTAMHLWAACRPKVTVLHLGLNDVLGYHLVWDVADLRPGDFKKYLTGYLDIFLKRIEETLGGYNYSLWFSHHTFLIFTLPDLGDFPPHNPLYMTSDFYFRARRCYNRGLVQAQAKLWRKYRAIVVKPAITRPQPSRTRPYVLNTTGMAARAKLLGQAVARMVCDHCSMGRHPRAPARCAILHNIGCGPFGLSRPADGTMSLPRSRRRCPHGCLGSCNTNDN